MEILAELGIVLTGALTSFIMGILKSVSAWVRETLPPWGRTVLVALLSAPVAWLAAQSGIDLPADVLSWDANTVNAVLTWLVAMGGHAALKAVRGNGESEG